MLISRRTSSCVVEPSSAICFFLITFTAYLSAAPHARGHSIAREREGVSRAAGARRGTIRAQAVNALGGGCLVGRLVHGRERARAEHVADVVVAVHLLVRRHAICIQWLCTRARATRHGLWRLTCAARRSTHPNLHRHRPKESSRSRPLAHRRATSAETGLPVGLFASVWADFLKVAFDFSGRKAAGRGARSVTLTLALDFLLFLTLFVLIYRYFRYFFHQRIGELYQSVALPSSGGGARVLDSGSGLLEIGLPRVDDMGEPRDKSRELRLARLALMGLIGCAASSMRASAASTSRFASPRRAQ